MIYMAFANALMYVKNEHIPETTPVTSPPMPNAPRKRRISLRYLSRTKQKMNSNATNTMLNTMLTLPKKIVWVA